MESTGLGGGLAMLATYAVDSSDADEEMPQSNPTVTPTGLYDQINKEIKLEIGTSNDKCHTDTDSVSKTSSNNKRAIEMCIDDPRVKIGDSHTGNEQNSPDSCIIITSNQQAENYSPHGEDPTQRQLGSHSNTGDMLQSAAYTNSVNNLRDETDITVEKHSNIMDKLGSVVQQNSLNQNSTHLNTGIGATSVESVIEIRDGLLKSPLPSDCQTFGSVSSADTNSSVVNNETNNINPIEERPETILNRDNFIDRRSRKNPYIENFSSDSESDSSSSSEKQVITVSSDSSSDEEVTPIITLPEKPKKPPPPPHNKTKGELALEDLPPIEDLHISVPESDIRKIGTVQSIVETQVIVQSFTNEPPYDLDSVLFLSGGKALGKVFDVFGKVTSPLYSIRFNSKESIVEQGINIGDDVFSAPEHQDVTKFVFTEDLKRLKGSDASWEHNNEPPPGCQDFSDDEEEKMFKQKLRSKHKTQNSEESENPATPQRKQKFANARNLPPKHFLRPQTFRSSHPNSTAPQNGSFRPTNPQQWGFRNQSPSNNFQLWGHHNPSPENTPHNFQPWGPNSPAPYQQHFPPPLHHPNSGNPHQNGGFNLRDFEPSSPRFQPLDPARFQHGFLGQTRPPFNPPQNFNFPHNSPSSVNFRSPPPNYRPGGPPQPNFGDSLPPRPTFGQFGPPPPNFGVSVPPPPSPRPMYGTFGSPPPNFSVTGPSPP